MPSSHTKPSHDLVVWSLPTTVITADDKRNVPFPSRRRLLIVPISPSVFLGRYLCPLPLLVGSSRLRLSCHSVSQSVSGGGIILKATDDGYIAPQSVSADGDPEEEKKERHKRHT